MKYMKSIALIIPYIGRFKKDIVFWMRSVENNPTIDFLLFTDVEVENPPENLHIFKFSFEELHALFQQNFDFKICLNKPYKFCDFRPSYGEVFAEYISGYDFWGYTDTDMVYGNLRKFVTDDLLDKYDHIFGRGHFSLYRNVKEVNREYRNVAIPTYKQVYTYDEGRAFDEYCGTSKHWFDNRSDAFFDAIYFDDIDCMEYSFHSQMRRNEYAGCKNFIFSYEKGTLYRIYEKDGKVHKDETMYVHLQKRQMIVNTSVSDQFLIIPNSYEKYEEIKDTERLEQLGRRGSFYKQRYKLKWDIFKSKFYKAYLKFHPSEFGFPPLPENISQFYMEK